MIFCIESVLHDDRMVAVAVEESKAKGSSRKTLLEERVQPRCELHANADAASARGCRACRDLDLVERGPLLHAVGCMPQRQLTTAERGIGMALLGDAVAPPP
jgi:hypothetical protein